MKKLLFAITLVGVLISCKSNDVIFNPTCTNIVLEKVDWTYCDPVRLIKCNDSRDTLVRKTSQIIENEVGYVKKNYQAGITFYCLESPSRGGFTPYNLPTCFKQDGLKIRFSGISKSSHIDYDCGIEFEITKIEEIP